MTNRHLRSAVLEAVENQLRDNTPPQVNITFDSLKKLGFSDEDAKAAIARALVKEMFEVMKYGREYDEDSYVRDLKQIARGELLYNGEDEEDDDFDDYDPYDDDYDLYDDDDEIDEDDAEAKQFLYEDLLRDQFSDDLRELAHSFGIRTKKKSKQQIAKDIAKALLDPDYFSFVFRRVHDDTMELFDRLMEEGSLKLTADIRKLIDGETGDLFDHYYHYSEEGTALVSDEVRSAYREIMTPEFHAERRRSTWISDCLLAFRAFYKAAPISVFADLYNTHPQLSVREEEVMDLLKAEGSLYSGGFVRVNDEIRAKELQKKKDYKRFDALRKDCDFEIPSCQEVADIGTHHYPASVPAYRNMKQFFEKSANDILSVMHDYFLTRLFETAGKNVPAEQLMKFSRTMNTTLFRKMNAKNSFSC